MLKARFQEIERLFKGENAPDRSIFYYDTRRAASISFTILTVLTIWSYLAAHQDLGSREVLFISSIITFLSFSLLYAQVSNSYQAFIPFCGFLLIAPIIFNDPNSGAWVTYGLLTIMIVIYLIGIEGFRISLISIVLLLAMQVFIANLNLESVTDNQDTLLGGTYFSTLWLLSVSAGGLWAKYGFFKFHDKIDIFYEDLYTLRYRQAAMNSKLNLSDNLNSQLHGTVLNTLIAYRESAALKVEKRELKKALQQDLAKLEASSIQENASFEDRLISALNFPAYSDRKIDYNLINLEKISREYEKQIIEIVREIVLNSIKHGSADDFVVGIQRINESRLNDIGIREENNRVEIRVDSNQPFFQTTGSNLADSQTLAQLLSKVESKFELRPCELGTETFIEIALPLDFTTLLSQIFSLRTAALQYIAKTYVSISFVFGTLAIPGYFFMNLDFRIVLLLCLQSILLFMALFRSRNSFIFAAIASLLALCTFPALTYIGGTCAQYQTTPWIFNSVIGSALFLIVVWERRIIRWLPAVFFFLSTQYFSSTLPQECNQLLAGSTPAIGLIVLISLGIAYFREKNSRKDLGAIETVKESTSSQLRREFKIERHRREVMQDLSDFASNLPGILPDSEEVNKGIELQIRKLRNFLICSEYFDNLLVDEIYEYSVKRFTRNHLTYLTILTDDFTLQATQNQIKSLLIKAELLVGNSDIYLSVSRGKDLEIRIEMVENVRNIERKFSIPGLNVLIS